MVPRLYELGGSLPRDIRDFATQAGCPDAYLPENWKDLTSIMKVLLEAEQCAIQSWGEVCDMTGGKNPRTYDIAQRIMQEEIEHEAWFIESVIKKTVWALQEKLSRTITIYIWCRWTQPPLIFFQVKLHLYCFEDFLENSTY